MLSKPTWGFHPAWLSCSGSLARTMMLLFIGRRANELSANADLLLLKCNLYCGRGDGTELATEVGD